VEPRLVGAPDVLVAVLVEKPVVGLCRLPAVDDEIPLGLLDITQELRADVAPPLPEELRPLALGPVGGLERPGVARLVPEDERDLRRPPRSWWALKKFSLPAVAIAAEALISRQSAAAATICARR
jgi:hypothetical protein